MAQIWYGHFDSTPEDRRILLAEDWAKYIRSFITDGIRNGGTCLQVTPDTGMAVRMDTGTANVQGYIFDSTENATGRYFRIAVPAAHNLYPRIDRVVLRLDRTIQNRKIEPQILLGVAATSPVPTALTRNENIWEISLAQIRIEASSLSIPANKITDERFQTDFCGLMNSVLGLDPSAWQRQFDDFMDGIRASFGRDAETAMEAWQRQFDEFMTWIVQAQQTWFTTVQQQLPKYASFDFGNTAAYPGSKIETVMSGDTVTSTMKNSASGKTIATSVTTKCSNSIVTVETVYQDDGVTILRKSTATTTISGNTITTTVV